MEGNTAFSLVRNPQKVGSVLIGSVLGRHMVSHQKIDPANAVNALNKSNKGLIASPGMDKTTAFSLVKNPQKVGSALVGGTDTHMVSCQKTDSAHASNHSNLNNGKHRTDHGPLRPPRPKIIPTETKSAYSKPSFASATDDTCQVDKEATLEVNYRKSGILSSSEDITHLQDYKTISEVQHIHKEKSLALSITMPQKGQQPVQYCCSTLGIPGAEKSSLPNQYWAFSEPDISVDCSTEHTAGHMESSNTSEVADTANMQKEMGQKIMSKSYLQKKKWLDFEGSCAIEAKSRLSKTWSPVIHAFGILKSEDKLGSTDRQEYSIPDSTINLPAATNNFPMKGLKHIPILKSSMEMNGPSCELASNKASLCLSLSDDPNDERKRKLSPYKKQEAAELGSYSPKPDFVSKYCFKRHKVFADKVEAGHENLKISESKDMQDLGRLSPQALALELNRNNTTNSSVEFTQIYPRSIMDGNCDLEQEKICTTIPNSTNLTDSVEVQTLHVSNETIGLELGSPAYSGRKVVYVKNTSQRIPSSESDWGKFLALSATSAPTTQGANLEKEMLENFEHRFNKLQAFLKRCDDDHYYYHGLRHLSAADRSAMAVQLEKRAMKLSLEEVKEFNRMDTLKIFRKTSGDTTTTQRM